MENLFVAIGDTYKNRLTMLLFTLIFIGLGIFTYINYQVVVVNTLDIFVNNVINHETDKNNEMMITFALNLFSAVGLGFMGFIWIKDLFSNNHYDISVGTSKVVSFFMGLAVICFSLIFFEYLFNKLIVLVVIGVLGAIYFSKRK